MQSLKFGICDYTVTCIISVNWDFSTTSTISITKPRFLGHEYTQGITNLVDCIKKVSFDNHRMPKDLFDTVNHTISLLIYYYIKSEGTKPCHVFRFSILPLRVFILKKYLHYSVNNKIWTLAIVLDHCGTYQFFFKIKRCIACVQNLFLY